MTQLSPHFTLAEMTFSETAVRQGIDNDPAPHQVENLRYLCEAALEPARVALGKVFTINSGYRSPKLNTAIGGSHTSAHMDGCAADVRVAGMNSGVFTRWFIRFCEREGIIVDQVIDEFGRWTHIAMARPGTAPRKQYLIASRVNGRTVYTPLVLE